MTDDKRHQDNLSEEDRSRIGKMGGEASHSGQKGGQAQSESSDENMGSLDNTSDMTLNDEDL